MATTNNKIKVVVTGAGGKLGGIVFRKLLSSQHYEAVGVVHSKESKERVLGSLSSTSVSPSQIHVADVADIDSLVKAFEGANKLFALLQHRS